MNKQRNLAGLPSFRDYLPSPLSLELISIWHVVLFSIERTVMSDTKNIWGILKDKLPVLGLFD